MASGGERSVENEHVWRFELTPLPDPNPTKSDLVIGFVRKTLRELLDFIVLTQDGQEVKVDGFKVQGKPWRNYEIFGDGS